MHGRVLGRLGGLRSHEGYEDVEVIHVLDTEAYWCDFFKAYCMVNEHMSVIPSEYLPKHLDVQLRPPPVSPLGIVL
jgi:hypothetical protein